MPRNSGHFNLASFFSLRKLDTNCLVFTSDGQPSYVDLVVFVLAYKFPVEPTLGQYSLFDSMDQSSHHVVIR